MFHTTRLLATVILTATVVPNVIAGPPKSHGSNNPAPINKPQHRPVVSPGTHRTWQVIPVVPLQPWQVVPVPNAVFGVMLTKTPDGAAAAAKLKTNDVIMSVGGVRTQTPEDLDAATAKFAGQKVIAVILDGATGEEKPVFVTPAVDGSFGATVQQVQVK